ncbi:hypothetical protein NOS3756_51550 [Nostoc sp. NIES-3756]|uniref:hypothetical protein n=1 Tax=Nostoc sp. NIES-3756 TaxID=1751286 RepID=UPI0007221363|nr:hypothetical protein [Nostoc sp. NIES-3756]BAT56153.1 hypothetical protein NOS3756_51550 [Nostoc sp. NIES-3756]BAY36082.1 hypothetical protein NIES2111_04020 [Nostoc sp. NIES-2111]
MISQKLNQGRVEWLLVATTSTIATLTLLFTTGCSPSELNQSGKAVEASQKNAAEITTKPKTPVLRVGFIGTKTSKIPIRTEGWEQQKVF